MRELPVELVLGPEPDAVPTARHFAAQALAGHPSDLVQDVELVVTELVTNALLHGHPPVRLRLHTDHGRIRVEVEDSGRDVPVRVRSGPDSMTGRGLGLVAALTRGWGVEAAESGAKMVWAELPKDELPDDVADLEGSDDELDVDAFLAQWSDDEDEPNYTVALGAVPTDLLLEAKAHIDNLVREFTLAEASAIELPVPSELSRLVRTVVSGFAAARTSIKRQAIEAADRGELETKLTLNLPASAADAGEEYLAALDEADQHARAARLLTLETPPVHRVFRRWYVQAIVDQLRAQAQGQPPPPLLTFPQRLGEEYSKLAPLQSLAARLSLLQEMSAELTGARDIPAISETVVRHATGVLGAHAAVVYLLDDDGMLNVAAIGGGGDSQLREQYKSFPVAADLPGGVALRSGQPVVIRNLEELTERFPALADAYPDERALLVAPLVVGEHKLGVLALTFRGSNRLSEDAQLPFLTTLADVTAQALERAVAASAAAEASERLAFLAEASVVLSSSLEYRTVLEAVAALAVPRLADWCVIQLRAGDSLQTVALTHVNPDKVQWANEYAGRYPTDMNSPTGAANVLRTGVSELYPFIPDELLEQSAVDAEHLRLIRELGMSSVLVVPLAGRTGSLGVLTLIQAESGRRYGPADVEFAEDLARRAALAVETAQEFREQSGRLAEVTRVAEAAQHAILAPPPSRLGPVALSACYVSAAAEALVGGDLYEVVSRPGAVRLLIGDVRGKGLEAVRTATIVLGEFRAAAADLDDLVVVAEQLDRRLRRYLADEDFVTAVVAEITDKGEFTIANCGHPVPLRTSNGVVSEVPCAPSLPLGLGATPTLCHGVLSTGDRLLLYTDGIIEARDGSREFVDLLSLAQPLAVGALDEVLTGMLDELAAAVGGALGDDLAMLVAEYHGLS
jgi:serine phosphatase RsbU (regulator of sigma subunit)/anti-sigma regulatory factor (Ser/Thr protein kinase)